MKVNYVDEDDPIPPDFCDVPREWGEKCQNCYDRERCVPVPYPFVRWWLQLLEEMELLRGTPLYAGAKQRVLDEYKEVTRQLDEGDTSDEEEEAEREREKEKEIDKDKEKDREKGKGTSKARRKGKGKGKGKGRRKG
ncbi:hypothetical protein N7520_008965 [Penicillium odoratum]|uniref:uncharacterized protein n=1 Tax=Penicillium odoratum TaxID=1167516 RepID=UPI002547004A|nr:uncharacterized protein N7520_008965 [Penicillium odoratum]KAJ5752048.1 hypothetical protein N7520_008965 [Penicillium odoratum]